MTRKAIVTIIIILAVVAVVAVDLFLFLPKLNLSDPTPDTAPQDTEPSTEAPQSTEPSDPLPPDTEPSTELPDTEPTDTEPTPPVTDPQDTEPQPEPTVGTDKSTYTVGETITVTFTGAGDPGSITLLPADTTVTPENPAHADVTGDGTATLSTSGYAPGAYEVRFVIDIARDSTMVVKCPVTLVAPITPPDPPTPPECEHSYTSWNPVEPTCTKTGVCIKTCSKCHDQITETLPALGHTAGTEWKSDKSGHWHTCTRCGEKLGSTQHTEGKAETDGSVKCSVCGFLMKEGACEHDWAYNKLISGDCRTKMETVLMKCLKCKETKEVTQRIDSYALSVEDEYHTLEIVSVDEARHSATMKCKYCSFECTSYYNPNASDCEKNGHRWVLAPGQENLVVTCQTTSVSAICSVCGKRQELPIDTRVFEEVTGVHESSYELHQYGPAEHITGAEAYSGSTHDLLDHYEHTCAICGYTEIVQDAKHPYNTKMGQPHTYPSWKTISTASATTDTVKERFCTVCGYRNTEVVDNSGTAMLTYDSAFPLSYPITEPGYFMSSPAWAFSSDRYTKSWTCAGGVVDYRKNIAGTTDVAIRHDKESISFFWRDSHSKDITTKVYVDDGYDYHILEIMLVINADESYYVIINHGYYWFAVDKHYGLKEFKAGKTSPDTPSYPFETSMIYFADDLAIGKYIVGHVTTAKP